MAIVKNIYGFLFITILFWGGQSVVFGKDVKITVDAPETVWENEEFSITYVVEYAGEPEYLPQISKPEGLKILYGPQISRSFSRSVEKGKPHITYFLKLKYIIQSGEKGKYTLPDMEVTYSGKKFRSRKQTIEVRSLNDLTQDQVAFVKAEVSKTTVRPGDTLTITYKLYTTMDVNRVIAMDSPRLSAFYMQNITPRRRYVQEENIDGKKYNVIELRKLLLQPVKEGNAIIPEIRTEIEFSIPTGEKVQNLWGEIYDETIEKITTFTFEAMTIKVYDFMEI